MLCYITYAFQNNRRSTADSFCLKQNKRLKKPNKKEYNGKCITLQPKQFETKVNKPHILSAHSSDESSFTDESIN